MLRILFALIIVSITRVAYALGPVLSPTPILKDPAGGGPSDIIANIISYFIMLTGIVSVMAITWGGIQMIVAVGEEEKIKKARHMIIYAFVGVVISGLAYGVVRFLANFQLS